MRQGCDDLPRLSGLVCYGAVACFNVTLKLIKGKERKRQRKEMALTLTDRQTAAPRVTFRTAHRQTRHGCFGWLQPLGQARWEIGEQRELKRKEKWK
jgi:hypothetical protein